MRHAFSFLKGNIFAKFRIRLIHKGKELKEVLSTGVILIFGDIHDFYVHYYVTLYSNMHTPALKFSSQDIPSRDDLSRHDIPE